MSRLAGEAFSQRNALVLSLVGKHRASDHITDRVDPRNVGGVVTVRVNTSPTIQSDAGGLQPETFDIRPTADCEEDNVSGDRFGGTTFGWLD